MRQIYSAAIVITCFLLNSFTSRAQPDKSKWVVIGQKNVAVNKIPPAPQYSINVSTRYKLPGKAVVKKIAATPTVSLAEEWAGYWNPRVNMESYLTMISDAGGFLLMNDEVKAVYPVTTTGGNSFLIADIRRNTAIAGGLVNLLRWSYAATTAGRFTMANSVAGYLQVLPVKGGLSYSINLSKSRAGAAEEFMWVVVPLDKERYINLGAQDIADGYNPGRTYKLVLYHPASKKIVAYNKEAGKTGLVLGSFEDYLGSRLPASWDADWEIVYLEAGLRPVPGRFATKMMAVANWDADGDGHISIECEGGDDCDDADGSRFPGNPEVCDAYGHDEDCNSATYGTTDADGDGFIDQNCFNYNASGTVIGGFDCDDTNPVININSGFYLYIDDSTIVSANCMGTIYRLPKEQIAIQLPNGTAHVSLRSLSPMMVPKQ
jgi:hypothetical protein